MSEIKIIYIDDMFDISLSKVLREKYGNRYGEYKFDSQKGYEELLTADKVRSANIIVIDSKLFEDSQVKDKKFTGEEFKIILKKISPFVEVIVITQNEIMEKEQTIAKYKKSTRWGDAKEYYNENLLPKIDQAEQNIIAYRSIANKLTNSNSVDKMLIDKINNSLDGIEEYNELKTEDVDALIKAFEELQKRING